MPECAFCGTAHENGPCPKDFVTANPLPDDHPWADDFIEPEDRDECPGCGSSRRCECDKIYANDDDQGPLDSDYGDSEGDHVWADLARSEAEW
jgi:hypothetical protein